MGDEPILAGSVRRDNIKRILWTFVQAFGGAFFVLAPGIWKAPNMQEAKAALVAAAIAGIAAGVSAVKNYVFAPGSKAR